MFFDFIESEKGGQKMIFNRVFERKGKESVGPEMMASTVHYSRATLFKPVRSITTSKASPEDVLLNARSNFSVSVSAARHLAT
jgi:hypothetical protein